MIDEKAFVESATSKFFETLYPKYRAEYEDPNIGILDELVIQELRELIELVDEKKFTAKSSCYLNPTFGEDSLEVGGADADLIIDNCLIDIKTTKYAEMKRAQFDQLVGYYILNEIESSNQKKQVKLDSLGIYFSRHGILYTFPTDPLVKENHEKFIGWFRKMAQES